MTSIDVWILRFEKTLRDRVTPAIRQFGASYSRLIMLVFLTLFLIGIYISSQVSGVTFADLCFVPFLGVFFGALVTNTFSAWGLQLIASYSSVHLPFREAILVTSFGHLSNLLPIPGSMIVRGGALVTRGATMKQSATGITLAGLLWIGMAGLLSGLSLAIQGESLGWIMIILCSVVLLIAIWGLALQGNPRLVAAFLLQRTAMLITMVLRFWLGFRAVNASASLIECATFVVAGVFGVIVAIVPAGLAVSEGIAAALASLTVLSPATTFIVVALNRIVGLFSNGIIFTIFILGRTKKNTKQN
ncbi:MAG: hypothetical protein ABGX16_16070 [Pirellulales bacterium]